jgi:hypothetical protein
MKHLLLLVLILACYTCTQEAVNDDCIVDINSLGEFEDYANEHLAKIDTTYTFDWWGIEDTTAIVSFKCEAYTALIISTIANINGNMQKIEAIFGYYAPGFHPDVCFPVGMPIYARSVCPNVLNFQFCTSMLIEQTGNPLCNNVPQSEFVFWVQQCFDDCIIWQ